MIFLFLLTLVVAVSGCINNSNETPSGGHELGATVQVGDGSSNEGSETPQNVQVQITSSGFEPKTVTINSGDTVTWINEQENPSWPASAVHPTHTVYPGSGIEKCSTSPDTIFDACSGLKEGESYSFTFTEIGSWGYHDHLRPNWTGKIIVQ